MDLGLQDRVAVVTGSSRGIGKAIAEAFAREGCRVAICARGRDDLRAAARDIEPIASRDRVLAVRLDLTTRTAARRLHERVQKAFGTVDILVNNLGGNRRKPFDETTDEDWDALLELNLLSALRLSREVIPPMKAQGRGALLFISSIWGREAGGTGYTLYNTTKSAMISAAKIMAIELAPAGIRVNTIAPGSILFPGGGWDRRAQDDPDGIAQFVRDTMPLGRFGTVEEVAQLALFLASDRASLINGACIPADGGQGKSLI
ncbi:MAG: SDR family NAD(P)-dependent oxidoreductase [Longimicrobiales bacterium]